jgi:hypothetical protein
VNIDQTRVIYNILVLPNTKAIELHGAILGFLISGFHFKRCYSIAQFKMVIVILITRLVE